MAERKPLPASVKKLMQKSMVKYSDMPGETQVEILDTIVGAVDKFSGPEGVNIETASRNIKDSLDKIYGAQWHCVMGRGFSFDITAQNGTLLHCFYQGDLAILVYKC